MTPWRFYIYLHRRSDTGEAFYVGKGTGRRAWNFKGRNPDWSAAAISGVTVEILAHCKTEAIAFALEKATIAEMGRTELVNRTSGGGGSRQITLAEEARRRDAEAAQEFREWKRALPDADESALRRIRGALEKRGPTRTRREGFIDREKWRLLFIAEAKHGILGAQRPSAWSRYSLEERLSLIQKRRHKKPRPPSLPITAPAAPLIAERPVQERPAAPEIQPLDAWLKSLGRCQRTGRVWEQSGRIEVMRIGPRKYVTAAAVERFFQAEEARGPMVNTGWFGQKS